MKRLFPLVFICFLALPSSAFPFEKGLTIKGFRFFSYASFTRIVLEIEAAAPYVLTKSPDSRTLRFSAYDGPMALRSALTPIHDSVVGSVETREEAGRTTLVIHLEPGAGEVKDFVLRGPDRVVIDIAKGSVPALPSVPADKPTLVMLDPGHGGKDTGIVTSLGSEKVLTLELAQTIKKILQKDGRIKVLLTRDKDHALSLDDRAAAANAAGVFVFVSIHMTDGARSRAYIEDLDEDPGRQVQASAGRDFLSFESESELQDKLWGRQQAAHTKESGSLGRALARQLTGNENAEPVQAPMAGLKAVDSAAVLVEAAAEQDKTKTAEAVAKGIEQHVREGR